MKTAPRAIRLVVLAAILFSGAALVFFLGFGMPLLRAAEPSVSRQ